MARRKGKKTSRPRKKFKGINVVNTGYDLVVADAGTRLVSNGGLWATFVRPFVHGAYQGRPYMPPVDNVFDIKEMFQVATGEIDLSVAGNARYGADTGGASGNLFAVLQGNFRDNIIPSTMTIVGASIVKQVIRKSGASRGANRIVKQIPVVRDWIKF